MDFIVIAKFLDSYRMSLKLFQIKIKRVSSWTSFMRLFLGQIKKKESILHNLIRSLKMLLLVFIRMLILLNLHGLFQNFAPNYLRKLQISS